ncbi:MAG: translation initiation factor IF-2 [Deltaproteobacteria bacterium]|nr:translation initiation factor IF-2 [Deltaproteobacteria bacterium]
MNNFTSQQNLLKWENLGTPSGGCEIKMKRYRIYELAKEVNLDSKALIDKARSIGIMLKSHSSSVTEEEKQLLMAALGQGVGDLESDKINKSQAEKTVQHSGAIIRRKKTQTVHELNQKEEKQDLEPGSDIATTSRETENRKNEPPFEVVLESKVSLTDQESVVEPQVKILNEETSSTVVVEKVEDTPRQPEPPIRVLGKIEVRAPIRSSQGNLQEMFDQLEKKEAPVKKPIRFKEAKSFVPVSPVQAPVRIDKEERKKSVPAERPPQPIQVRTREVKIDPIMTVGEFAAAINVKVSEVIQKLLSYGETKTINDIIDADTMSVLAEEYNVSLTFQSLDEKEVFPDIFEIKRVDYQPRPPIVTVMGHVDHGKTTLLDTIRQTNVVSKEAGGITQHIGAYTVIQDSKPITFIDTPGHEAFTEIRSRGAKVTDIVVLVVAADDGVMPQTIEAINHAKSAGVPIIVAVNKIDKPEANPEPIKTRLSEEGLVPEEWGGDVIYVPISALKGTNIDKLLSSINLLAEILDLKAPKDGCAKCFILEARQEKGRGWVATVIPMEGTLKQGDVFICGSDFGRVRTITSPTGEPLKSLEPGFPGEISGFTSAPSVGEELLVVQNEGRARELVEFRKKRELKLQAARQTFSLEEFSKLAKEEKLKELRLILKTDTQGSCDALLKSLHGLQFQEIGVKIVHSGIGFVTESDVKLAKASEGLIIAFNVGVDPRAAQEAESRGVEIRRYRIIYECIDDIKDALQGLLGTEKILEERGSVEVRKVFESSKVGKIAGCFVTKGNIRRNHKVKVLRNGKELFLGGVKSLKRFKDDVSEVQQGYECGIVLEGFDDFVEGDTILFFEEVERQKNL